MTSKIRLILASIIAVSALGAVAPAANAYLYWVDAGSTIGRAKLDGSSVNKRFIAASSSSVVKDVAVDSGHIYWTNDYVGVVIDTIGRSGLTGWGKTESFIGPGDSNGPVRNPQRLAVTASDIYWANCFGAYVNHAGIDGSNPTNYFLNTSSCTRGVAVDGTHIYWSRIGGSPLRTYIGRASLNGTGSTALISDIDAGGDESDLVIDSNYLYWTNPKDGTIGRANLDGSSPDANFITGASNPKGLAVDSGHIYWSNGGTTSIGRAALNGAGSASDVQQNFITGVESTGIAVDSLDPANSPIGSLSPSSSSFGEDPIADGPSAPTTFTLSSSGTADLSIPASGITLTGTNSDQFQVTGGTCVAGTSSLSNGQSCTVTVTFNPSSIGAKSATLQVQTSDGDKTATLSGTGITAPAGSLSPSTYDFGSHLLSTETPATFTLTSSGSEDLDIEGLSISGAGGENYGILNDGTCSIVSTLLANGQSCTVVVNFNPLSTGSKSAALDVATNAGSKSATLSGTGIVNPTIQAYGKPTKRSLKVEVGCGDASACTLRLTGKKVGTNAAVTPKTVSVDAGTQPVVTLAYSKALKKAVAKGGKVAVTATNTASGTNKSVTMKVAR